MELEARVELLENIAEQANRYRKRTNNNVQPHLQPIFKETKTYHADVDAGSHSVILFGIRHAKITGVIFVESPNENCLKLYGEINTPVYLLAGDTVKLIQPAKTLHSYYKNKNLCEAYKKHILGCPLDELKLDPKEKELLVKFMKANCQGRSLFQVQQECAGFLSPQLCFDLRQVAGQTHRGIKILQGKYRSKKIDKFAEKDPEIADFVRKTRGKPKKIQSKVQSGLGS